MKTRTPKTPAYDGPPGLSAAAQELWVSYTTTFVIDDAHGRMLLRLALEAHDRMREAQEHISRRGATSRTALALRSRTRASRSKGIHGRRCFALRRLNLEVEGVAAPGRPPAAGGADVARRRDVRRLRKPPADDPRALWAAGRHVEAMLD